MTSGPWNDFDRGSLGVDEWTDPLQANTSKVISYSGRILHRAMCGRTVAPQIILLLLLLLLGFVVNFGRLSFMRRQTYRIYKRNIHHFSLLLFSRPVRRSISNLNNTLVN